jgi:hypothetical protein
MLINVNMCLELAEAPRVRLVPYRPEHVPRYHGVGHAVTIRGASDFSSISNLRSDKWRCHTGAPGVSPPRSAVFGLGRLDGGRVAARDDGVGAPLARGGARDVRQLVRRSGPAPRASWAVGAGCRGGVASRGRPAASAVPAPLTWRGAVADENKLCFIVLDQQEIGRQALAGLHGRIVVLYHCSSTL